MLVRVEMRRLPAEQGDELRELRRDLRLDRRAVVRDDTWYSGIQSPSR